MKILRKAVAMLCTAIIACTCLGISAFAAEYDETITKISTKEDVKSLVNFYRGADSRDARGNSVFGDDNTSNVLKGGETIVMDKTYGVFACITRGDGDVESFEICYDNATFADMTQDEQKKATQEMVSTFSSWGMSTDATSKFSDKIIHSNALPYTNADAVAALFNQGADINAAMGWFAPFQGAVGLVLGVLVVILMVLLIASTVLDLVYIGLPTARMAMTSKANEGGKDTPFGISSDALRIVNESTESGKGNGGNVYLKYFKSRILTYIILAVCILYLVSGQIGTLIGGLLDMVSGIG